MTPAEEALELPPASLRADFLGKLSYALLQDFDFGVRLSEATRLCALFLCDWCAINILDEKNGLRRFSVVHREAELTAQAELLKLRYPPLHDLADEIVTLHGIEDRALRDLGLPDEEVQLLKNMGCAVLLIIPLRGRSGAIGNITFARAAGSLSQAETMLMTEVARLVALAADNAHIHADAQRAIRIREEVLGVVSHDLKNPLAAIRLTTKIIQRKYPIDGPKEIPATEVHKMIQSVDRAVERSLRLITDVLDFSHAASGTIQIDAVPMEVLQLLSEGVDFQKVLAAERSIDLQWSCPPGNWKVLCEADRIQQVLSNLIGNAIKFTPPGGKIRVTAVPQGTEVLFTVQDTGPGVRAEDIPHLFERYWQAPETKKMGSGLGLPICKGIIEAHGGRIWAVSEPGHGTCFYFTLAAA